jgi:hypothetical protein
MKMAIVKKIGEDWSITQIGLSNEEVDLLQSELKKSDQDKDYCVSVPFRVTFHQSEG